MFTNDIEETIHKFNCSNTTIPKVNNYNWKISETIHTKRNNIINFKADTYNINNIYNNLMQ